MNFKIKSVHHFLPSFLRKNGNFKTRDFSPLIKRILAGMIHITYLIRACLFHENKEESDWELEKE